MIVGHGIDLVNVSRIKRLHNRFGDRFLRRCFTTQEIKDCQMRSSPDTHFAVRFAAKEAFMKALGTGYSDGIRWKDIEVISGGGAPKLRTCGRAEEMSLKHRVVSRLLSLTHDGEYGAASILLLGNLNASLK